MEQVQAETQALSFDDVDHHSSFSQGESLAKESVERFEKAITASHHKCSSLAIVLRRFLPFFFIHRERDSFVDLNQDLLLLQGPNDLCVVCLAPTHCLFKNDSIINRVEYSEPFNNLLLDQSEEDTQLQNQESSTTIEDIIITTTVSHVEEIQLEKNDIINNKSRMNHHKSTSESSNFITHAQRERLLRCLKYSKLLTLHLFSGETIDIPCAIQGSLIDINKKLLTDPMALLNDPYGTGHLCVIRPFKKDLLLSVKNDQLKESITMKNFHSVFICPTEVIRDLNEINFDDNEFENSVPTAPPLDHNSCETNSEKNELEKKEPPNTQQNENISNNIIKYCSNKISSPQRMISYLDWEGYQALREDALQENVKSVFIHAAALVEASSSGRNSKQNEDDMEGGDDNDLSEISRRPRINNDYKRSGGNRGSHCRGRGGRGGGFSNRRGGRRGNSSSNNRRGHDRGFAGKSGSNRGNRSN